MTHRHPKIVGRNQPFLAAAAVLYMLGATAWALPGNTPVQRIVRGNFSELFTTLGLWQNWNMFAPVPKHVDAWVAATVEFEDGTVVEWPLTRTRAVPWWDRYRKDRWRKYFGDDFPQPTHAAAWDPASRWLAATAARDRGRDPGEVVQVELLRYSRPCLRPAPGWEGWSAFLDSQEYRRRAFHTWRADAR